MFIRLLQKSDYPNYLDLMRQFRPICDINYDQFCTIYDEIFKTSEIYVAETGDQLVGSITVIYEQKFINDLACYAHIEDVIVHSDYRHQKIGSKLISYAKTKAKQKNCFKCVLVCNESVIPFYTKNGFEPRGINMSCLF